MSFLERVDRDILIKEQKEQEDREFYENTLDEIQLAFEQVLHQAKEDEILASDVFDCFKTAVKDTLNKDITFIEKIKLKNLEEAYR